MNAKPIEILLIEDNPGDARLIREMLAEVQGAHYNLECAARLSAGLDCLAKKKFHIILLDLGLPDSQGLDTLARAQAARVPVVVLTCLDDERAAKGAVHQGAQDYLVKGQINGRALWRVINYAIERNRVEERLRASEENYRELADSISDVFFAMDKDLRYTYWNRASEQLIGVSAKDALGKHLYDIFPDVEATKRAGKVYLEVLRTGQPQTFINEYSIADKDFWFEISVYLTKTGVSVFAKDITKRHRAEQLLQDVFTSAAVGMYIVQDGKFQRANPQFQKLVGYGEKELMGMDSMDIALPEDRNIVRKNAISMLKRPRLLPYEFRYVTRKGETRWALESVSYINYRGKRATLGSFMDISETKRIEERMLMSSKLVSLGELAAGVAHEINNPLTSVMGFAQLVMAREGVPQDIKEDLDKIYQESRRVVKIVQNLLSFARQSPADKSYTDMNELIEKTLELRSYELKTSNITLATKFAADIPLVMADLNQIQQVILNIIINAEQAIAEAKGKGKITVTTSREKDCVRISIADNGPGIAPENITRVFDPFFTTKPVGKGSGLGLSVCHGIVTEHGGKIYVESTAGKGATFTIELPAVEGVAARDGEKVTRKMQRRRRQKTSSIFGCGR